MPEQTLDTTDDLTRDQLAELAFAEEVVVQWPQDLGDGPTGEILYGIIVGYDDEDQMFRVGLAAPVYNGNRIGGWVETGEMVPMRREDFTVFGPANRDPEHREVDAPPEHIQTAMVRGLCRRHGLGCVDLESAWHAFSACARDLTQVGMGDFMSNEPAFKVRLDVDARENRGPGGDDGEYPRSFRILVRPVMHTILHDEITVIQKIAESYGLHTQHSNAGIEVRMPGDVS